MEGFRDDILSRARFAGDEQRCIGLRNRGKNREEVLHLGAAPDEGTERVGMAVPCVRFHGMPSYPARVSMKPSTRPSGPRTAAQWIFTGILSRSMLMMSPSWQEGPLPLEPAAAQADTQMLPRRMWAHGMPRALLLRKARKPFHRPVDEKCVPLGVEHEDTDGDFVQKSLQGEGIAEKSTDFGGRECMHLRKEPLCISESSIGFATGVAGFDRFIRSVAWNT